MQRLLFFGVLGAVFVGLCVARKRLCVEQPPPWLLDWVRLHHPPTDATIAIDRNGVATWITDPTPPPPGQILYRVTGNDPCGTLRVTQFMGGG